MTKISTIQPVSRSPESLSPQEAARLDEDLRLVREGFRAVLAEWPVEVQSASGLARHLGIERTTCQRLVAAVTGSYPGVELLAALPGTKGLAMLIRAARQRPELSVAALNDADAAVEKLELTVRALGGSRSGLIRRLAIDHAQADAQSDESAAEQMFRAAQALTGRSSDVWLASYVYTPIQGQDRVSQARVHGLIGHRAQPQAVPLTFHVFGEEHSEDGQAQGGFRPLLKPDVVLREYSTSPLPMVRSRTPGEHVVQTIEERGGQSAEGIDLVFGMVGSMTNPAVRPSRLEEVWALVNFPVRRMLFDCFLHRDLARACIPSLDHHLWRPDFATTIGERWQTRFPDSPRLELLPVGLDHARSGAWSRYAELVGLMFESEGLRPQDYVGYRCDLDLPVWRTGYRMAFDFG